MRCKQTIFLFLENKFHSSQRKIVYFPYIEIKMLQSIAEKIFNPPLNTQRKVYWAEFARGGYFVKVQDEPFHTAMCFSSSRLVDHDWITCTMRFRDDTLQSIYRAASGADFVRNWLVIYFNLWRITIKRSLRDFHKPKSCLKFLFLGIKRYLSSTSFFFFFAEEDGPWANICCQSSSFFCSPKPQYIVVYPSCLPFYFFYVGRHHSMTWWMVCRSAPRIQTGKL